MLPAAMRPWRLHRVPLGVTRLGFRRTRRSGDRLLDGGDVLFHAGREAYAAGGEYCERYARGN